MMSWPSTSDLAGGRIDDAADDADQRRLAGAVRAEQRENLAAPDLQVDVLQRLEAAGVGLREMRDGNGGGHGLRHSGAELTGPVRSGRSDDRLREAPGIHDSLVSGYGLRAGRFAALRNDGVLHAQGRAALAFSSKLSILSAFDYGQADVVEAVEQAVLAVRVDVELDHAAVGAADFLLLQIDR